MFGLFCLSSSDILSQVVYSHIFSYPYTMCSVIKTLQWHNHTCILFMERDIGCSANYKICFILKLNYCFKSLRHKCKTNLNLCMTKIHWNQIIHIHQNTSVYKQKIYWFLHDQSSLESIHDHLSSFFLTLMWTPSNFALRFLAISWIKIMAVWKDYF